MAFTPKNISMASKRRSILFQKPSETSFTKEISLVADVMTWYVFSIQYINAIDRLYL
jgi:hypothetical protein